jgi:hypothetical protein
MEPNHEPEVWHHGRPEHQRRAEYGTHSLSHYPCATSVALGPRAGWWSSGCSRWSSYVPDPDSASGVKMGERYTSWLSFLNNMREAATRTDSVSLPCNPYPPDTAEHERWWADLIGSRLSNSDNPKGQHVVFREYDNARDHFVNGGHPERAGVTRESPQAPGDCRIESPSPRPQTYGTGQE